MSTKTQELRRQLGFGPFDHQGFITTATLKAMAEDLGISYGYAVLVARGHGLRVLQKVPS